MPDEVSVIVEKLAGYSLLKYKVHYGHLSAYVHRHPLHFTRLARFNDQAQIERCLDELRDIHRLERVAWTEDAPPMPPDPGVRTKGPPSNPPDPIVKGQ